MDRSYRRAEVPAAMRFFVDEVARGIIALSL
jgi:hypothetical protein